MHIGALQQQGQVAFAAQQRFDPVGNAHGGNFGHAALVHPLAGARHQPHQPRARLFAQGQHARVLAPGRDPVAKGGGQRFEQFVQALRGGWLVAVAAFAFFFGAAQQLVKLLRHHFAVGVELVQKLVRALETQGAGNPGQVGVLGGQHMGLLVVQVLNAVLHLAQEDIGLGQCLGGGLGHQAGLGQPLQRVQGGAGAQLGKLPAAHHLQQLHGELDLSNAAA